MKSGMKGVLKAGVGRRVQRQEPDKPAVNSMRQTTAADLSSLPGAVIVQKFGGTSVGSVARIKAVAEIAINAQRAGRCPVVVVSAMSGETNRLLGLAADVAVVADRRELDALAASGEQASAALTAIAIREAGGKARSLLGHQVRVLTDAVYGDARIRSVESKMILDCLRRGEIPVIAGFQGIDPEGNVTTLGRGGSDTTAVGVAAALASADCEIFTDVDGVYTADPRICPTARKLERVSYEHMLTLATLGAKVLHDRCVELARDHGVPVHVRTSFGNARGTWITAPEAGEEMRQGIAGVACERLLGHAVLTPKAGPTGLAATLAAFKAADIGVKSVFEGQGDASFTLLFASVPRARALITAKDLPVAVIEDAAAVSLVGHMLDSDKRLVEKAAELLRAQSIEPRKYRASATEIMLIVAPERADEAMRTLHDGMGVGESQPKGPVRHLTR
jgi:aspartate kinase